MSQKTFTYFYIQKPFECRNKFKFMVFENNRKSLIQHCERSEQHLCWQKFIKNGTKNSNATF